MCCNSFDDCRGGKGVGNLLRDRDGVVDRNGTLFQRGEMFWKDLERDFAEKFRVARSEDDAHGTSTDLCRHLVHPDAASHSNRHLPSGALTSGL